MEASLLAFILLAGIIINMSFVVFISDDIGGLPLKVITVFTSCFWVAGVIWFAVYAMQPWRVSEFNRYVPVDAGGGVKVFVDRDGYPHNLYTTLGRDQKIVIECRYSRGPYAGLMAPRELVEYVDEN